MDDWRGRVWAVDAETGDPAEDAKLPYLGFHVVEGGGTVYVCGADRIWTTSDDLDVESELDVRGKGLFSPPTLTAGRIVASIQQGRVVAFGK